MISRSGPVLDHLGRIGYDGYVSLEVLNPQLWQVPARPACRPGISGGLPVARTLENADARTPGRTLSVSTVATMRPAATIFREEQYFDWRVYTLIAALELLAGYCLVWLTRHWGPVAVLLAHRWSLEFNLGLLICLALPLVLAVWLAPDDHGGHPDRGSRLVRLGADLSPRGVDHGHSAVPRRPSTGRSSTTAAGASAPAATASACSTPAAIAAFASSWPTARSS